MYYIIVNENMHETQVRMQWLHPSITNPDALDLYGWERVYGASKDEECALAILDDAKNYIRGRSARP